jgi:AcrR family transcriptional regulator
MGRRENNRIRRHAAMINAAAKLFKNEGFEQVRLEDIAKNADVSIATFYNYFPTKGHLVIEIYKDDLIRIHDAQDLIIENPPELLLDAIMDMLMVEVNYGYGFKDRLIWREIYSTAIAFTDASIDLVNPLDPQRIAPYKQLLQKFNDNGKLSPATNITSLADVICSLNEAHFLSRLLEENINQAEFLDRLRRNVETVLTSNIAA